MTTHPIGIKISGTGSYLPERILTNKDLERMVETTNDWILSRTGIAERRIAADNEATSNLGAKAAQQALDAAGLRATDLDVVIVATITPDKIFPNTACLVQQQIGATRAFCFSIEAACSGFVYMMEVAASLIRSGAAKHALIVGAEKLSTIINWEDRSTCVLFGDGAGAAVLSATTPEENMLLTSTLGADGGYSDILHVPGGGAAHPFSQYVLDHKLHYLEMSGPEVFKQAVNSMATAAGQVLAEANYTVDDITWLIPHQANTRIISSVAKRLGLDESRAFINLDRYGNTSAATIPIALDEMVRTDVVKRGDLLLMVAFGGGLTWGANLVRW